jgi:hypothetical protein
MEKKTSSVTSTVAWWLADGDEECPHCGRFYFYELEFRCTECDGPGCPHCQAIHAEGHLICPDCKPDGREQA